MRSTLSILLVSMLMNGAWAQSEAPNMDDMFRQMQERMQQMMEQFNQGSDGFMQIDTFFFMQPGELNAPFGVLPPTTEDADLEQILEQLRKSMEGINEDPLLNLSEFFRSFGDIQMEPYIQTPEREPNTEPSKPGVESDKPNPNQTSPGRKKRKIYTL